MRHIISSVYCCKISSRFSLGNGGRVKRLPAVSLICVRLNRLRFPFRIRSSVPEIATGTICHPILEARYATPGFPCAICSFRARVPSGAMTRVCPSSMRLIISRMDFKSALKRSTKIKFKWFPTLKKLQSLHCHT